MNRGRLPKQVVFGNLEGCSAERTGWGGKRVDLLRTERHPGVWHSRGLKSDGVSNRFRAFSTSFFFFC